MSCRFPRLRRQLAAAKRTDIEAQCRGAAYQQGRPFPVYRRLSADGAAGAMTASLVTEETCPLA